jgi:hypothetical protein
MDLLEIVEDVGVQDLVAVRAIESLNEGILSG